MNTEVRVPRRDRVQSSSVTYAHWTAGGERTASCRRFVTGTPCLITVHRVLLFLAQHAALNGCECDPRIDPPIVRSLGLTVVLPPSQPDKADYTSFDWLINCRTTSAFCWRFERRSHVLSNLPSQIANAGFGWPWHSTFKFVRGSTCRWWYCCHSKSLNIIRVYTVEYSLCKFLFVLYCNSDPY